MMENRTKLSNKELAVAKYNLAEAKASLACEGMYFTQEEDELFRSFEEERISHEERRRRLIEFCREKRAYKAHAAAAE